MSVDQETLAFPDQRTRQPGAPVAGMHPLQQASMRIADFRDGRSLLKAKDLVGLLLCHGARAWRASQPVAHPSIHVETLRGTPAVRLKFQRS